LPASPVVSNFEAFCHPYPTLNIAFTEPGGGIDPLFKPSASSFSLTINGNPIAITGTGTWIEDEIIQFALGSSGGESAQSARLRVIANDTGCRTLAGSYLKKSSWHDGNWDPTCP
jgi:hypothetical protein